MVRRNLVEFSSQIVSKALLIRQNSSLGLLSGLLSHSSLDSSLIRPELQLGVTHINFWRNRFNGLQRCLVKLRSVLWKVLNERTP